METHTIYIPLLGEGPKEVWRPVEAERLDDARYRVLGPVPTDESWLFAPGDIVRVETMCLVGAPRREARQCLAAVEKTG